MGSKESSIVAVFQRQLVFYRMRTRSRKLHMQTLVKEEVGHLSTAFNGKCLSRPGWQEPGQPVLCELDKQSMMRGSELEFRRQC